MSTFKNQMTLIAFSTPRSSFKVDKCFKVISSTVYCVQEIFQDFVFFRDVFFRIFYVLVHFSHNIIQYYQLS